MNEMQDVRQADFFKYTNKSKYKENEKKKGRM